MTAIELKIAGFFVGWGVVAQAAHPERAGETWPLALAMAVAAPVAFRAATGSVARGLARQEAEVMALIRANDAAERRVARQRAELEELVKLAARRKAGGT